MASRPERRGGGRGSFDYRTGGTETPGSRPGLHLSEFLEEWSRTLLRLGDGTVVKHYPGGNTSNPVGEIVHVDSATMFKRLDDRGFTEGYVQFVRESSSAGKDEFEDPVRGRRRSYGFRGRDEGTRPTERVPSRKDRTP